MKKFFVVLLTLAVAGGAFAQLKKEFSFDFRPDVFKVMAPTGDAANNDPDADDLYKLAAGTSILGLNTPLILGGYQGAGKTYLLASSGYWNTNTEVRAKFTYTKDNFSTMFQFQFDDLFKAGNQGGEYLLNGSKTPTLDTVWSMVKIGDWNAKGTIGDLALYVGNESDRGLTSDYRFGTFDDILKVKLDNFGIVAPVIPTITSSGTTNKSSIGDNPSASGFAYVFGFADIDANNFLRNWSWNTKRTIDSTDYYSFQPAQTSGRIFTAKYTFSDFTVGAAYDFSGTGADIPSSGNSIFGYNAAIRFSGKKIADLVTFDVFYSVNGGDSDTDDSKASPEPDGKGAANHVFGIYAGLSDLVPNLGIGFGFTGMFKTVEDQSKDSSINRAELKTTYPFYAGIDLRAQYKGLMDNKMTITFNNNISFASATGDKDNKTKIVGIYSADLGDKQSEGWFALYNALNVEYKLSDSVAAELQFGNRLGILTVEQSDKAKITASVDDFSAGAFAVYSLSSNVKLTGGLGCRWVNSGVELSGDTYKNLDDTKAAWGQFTFAIPLRVQISW